MDIQMAYNTGHDNLTTTPRSIEIEGELVVFDILIPSNWYLLLITY